MWAIPQRHIFSWQGSLYLFLVKTPVCSLILTFKALLANSAVNRLIWSTMLKNIPLDMWIQQGFRSACTFMQSDWNLTRHILDSQRTNKTDMCPAKIQIRLHIRAVWSESSLGTFWIAKDTMFLHLYKKNSDRSAWMYRLICLCWAHISEGKFSHIMANIFAYSLEIILDEIPIPVFWKK